MISIYEERGIEKGRTEGVQATLIRQGTRKFGEPSQGDMARISAIRDRKHLENLADRIFDATTWEELLAE